MNLVCNKSYRDWEQVMLQKTIRSSVRLTNGLFFLNSWESFAADKLMTSTSLFSSPSWIIWVNIVDKYLVTQTMILSSERFRFQRSLHITRGPAIKFVVILTSLVCPIDHLPLFQNESSSKTWVWFAWKWPKGGTQHFHMIWLISQGDWFWQRGNRQLGNGPWFSPPLIVFL